MNYILYNPLAANGNGDKNVEIAREKLFSRFGKLEVVNLLEIDQEAFIKKINKDDNLVLVGGDGTLNRVANAIQDIEIPCPFYLYKAGTGNDFLRDVEKDINDDGLVLINEKIKSLPYVIVNDKKYYFLNGVGLGIDGEVCHQVEIKKQKGKKKISYALVCVKLALFSYKCPKAKIIIDGNEEFIFKRAYIGSAMNGKFFGGGLMIAPQQDRNTSNLTMVSLHDCNRIKALLVFTGIFKGNHVKHTKVVKIVQGKKIEVTFDKPISLQIDGEVIENVTHYIAYK